MKVLFENQVANLSYDILSDSIISIFKQNCSEKEMENIQTTLVRNIENYPVSGLIQDVTALSNGFKDSCRSFLKNHPVIRNKVKKIAFIRGEEHIGEAPEQNIRDCSSLTHAQAWMMRLDDMVA
ncbi:MAG TPA: hypothetical protein DDY13_01180 [Cytophagales bacterium]|jgi:hypothetical protein|nr:hypothetical protein [Cytophagales bacterium]